MLGLYSQFEYNEEKHSVSFQVNNCPFKEAVTINPDLICQMHHAFIKGMFQALFNDVELFMEENTIANGCENCLYTANIPGV
ncbi:hypothetical protein D8M04_02070 [Oceanobacillus piezotolerans]|uniref:Metanogen output domain-containing protein n=1 Tax=Oceanobacillus piezotolerans TaxID=2448030 RepID=A0A498D9T1_9BACI|nr:methanogen output domain 1-containing protein [Oceanobacillus piezotolerans]RLL48083.1 hypothetical protein D8M04_02070 [Oceanobacillus piezotolerans]